MELELQLIFDNPLLTIFNTRIPEGRPAYMKHLLFADNLVVAKGKRAVLEKTAHGVRSSDE